MGRPPFGSLERGPLVHRLVAAAMFALWWVITTNSEGDPGDPELLPIFAAIPLGIGVYRVIHG